MTDNNGHKYSKLPDLIDDLKPHDHLCLIYESREEWLATVVPFISSGLKKGEKCIYVVDANTSRQIKEILKEAGLAVDDYESKGQLSILHERDTYTREGYFDPDLMIALLIEETKNALNEGYPALRVTGEMSWALRGYGGVEKVLEYEAKLNRDLFPNYPCVAICQYDRWKFDPEIIKGVVMTHPLLIRGGQIYHNYYYTEPNEYLNHKKGEIEVQCWLNNLERERKSQESLRQSEEKHRQLFETMTQGVIYQAADGEIISANPAAENTLGLSIEQMQSKTSSDPHWQMIEENGTPVPGTEHPTMIALRTGQKVGPVTRGVFHPDKNSHIWLSITAIPLFLPGEEKPFQAYATFADITEQKHVAEEIIKRDALLQKIFDLLPIGLWFADEKGKLLRGNPEGVRIWGGEPQVGQSDYGVFKAWRLPSREEIAPDDWALAHTINEGITVADELLEIEDFKGQKKIVLNYTAPVLDEKGNIQGAIVVNQDITELKKAKESLQKIEWMLSQKQTPAKGDQGVDHDQGYGDLTALNRDGIILKAIGPEFLRNFSNDYLELLGTSSAIYEANGDYAFGIFSSGWCRMMDKASRNLCDTPDNVEALNSGRWLCHESCWTDCSKKAILKREQTDIECNGGIRLYAVPIIADGEVVGAINFGYGDPPEDKEKLQALADAYQLNYDDLVREAHAYDTRPSYIIEMAKKRLHATARLIGLMIEKMRAEYEIRTLNEELEQRVIERTAQLEAANRELDAFTYSASHDLRGPLNRISGFSEALLEDFANQLDPQGKDYLQRIFNSSRHMGELIDDLLKLSRVSQQQISREPVEISALVNVYLKELQSRDPDRQVELVVASDQVAEADTALIRIALENLLDNAWKFSAGKALSRIEFGNTVWEEKEVFYIRDNGSGFDMKHAEKLFTAFQRLHDAKTYPGTGIGLSIVSRIISRHGGEVWAEGEPGKGACFFFTLP